MALDAIELHKVNLQEFMKAIDLCKGAVYLVTREGDRLNLKSKLCQLIGLTTLIEGGIVSKARIECEKPEDESLLFRFNLYGKNVLNEKKN